MSGDRRIGVLGGSFDPIHIGHLIAAEEAVRQLHLDQVLLAPAKDQWRKPGRNLAPAADRLAMVRLAVAGNDRLAVTEVDLRRAGSSYTSDTLEDVHAELGPGVTLYFILGFDALADLPHWRDPARILELAVMATAVRPGYQVPWGLLETVSANVRERVVTIEMPEVGISSTEIRRRVAAGESVRYWVPDAVVAYIHAHGLYGAGR